MGIRTAQYSSYQKSPSSAGHEYTTLNSFVNSHYCIRRLRNYGHVRGLIGTLTLSKSRLNDEPLIIFWNTYSTKPGQ